MRAIWLTVLFTASAWVFLLPVYKPAALSFVSPASGLIGAALISAAVSFRRFRRDVLTSRILVLVPAFLFMGIYFPAPYTIAPWMATAGLFIYGAARYMPRLFPLSFGLLATGGLLLLQSVLIPILYAVMSRIHEIKWLNQLAYPVIRVMGIEAGISESIIYLPLFQDVTAFPGTLEKTGFFLWALILLSGAAMLFLLDRRWKTVFYFAGAVLGYAAYRYILMLLVFIQMMKAEIYWNPVWLAFSFFPLGLALCALFPVQAEFSHESEGVFVLRGAAAAMVCFFLSAFCLTGVFLFEDPGIRKSGKILIDEAHSDWEWTARKFDTTWYGSRSTYNYYCLADYLDHFYSVSQNVDQPLSDDLLSGYDVLILKTPTREYEDPEVESVLRFVENGGGLWLIGDHTNVFGMNLYLNKIAKRYGLLFHYDSTYDLDKGTLTFYTPPKALAHPIVRNMKEFLFATSCTLDAPVTAENIMIGYGLRTRLLAYSERGFFSQEPTQDYEFGLFLQAAGVFSGKGRVAAFTDSTCFSNFYMFIPGKPELALGTVEWLNRSNRFLFLHWIFGMTAVLAFAGGIYSAIRNGARIFPAWLFSALCGCLAGFLVFLTLSGAAYPLPEPHTGFKTITFETEHSDFVLPRKRLVDDEPNNYHTFYVWTQRTGLIPRIADDFSSALTKSGFVVLINPDAAFSPEEIEDTRRFVERGGRLLILDGPQNRQSAANQILAGFGMKRTSAVFRNEPLYSPDGRLMATGGIGSAVQGGNVYLAAANGEAVFILKHAGEGLVGLMGDSSIFANPRMGGTQIKPDQARQRIYDLEFYILGLMNGAP